MAPAPDKRTFIVSCPHQQILNVILFKKMQVDVVTDEMAVHAPLSYQAQAEAWQQKWY